LGQKVCPIGLRIGIIKTWDSKWYAEKNKYTELLHEDIKIRSLIKGVLSGGNFKD
jgi:small subunit ribosomal protein S3